MKTAATLFDLDSIVLKRPPEYVPNRKRLEDEESRYFVPTMRPGVIFPLKTQPVFSPNFLANNFWPPIVRILFEVLNDLV